MVALARGLVIAAIAWPAWMAAAVWVQIHGRLPAWAAIVYAAGSVVCHQIPSRSFHTAGVQWPVCGRCAGLYLSAPIGAIIAGWRLRPSSPVPASVLWMVAIAAAPTVLTLAMQWTQLSTLSNPVRFVAALPAGAALAYIVIRTAASRTATAS